LAGEKKEAEEKVWAAEEATAERAMLLETT